MSERPQKADGVSGGAGGRRMFVSAVWVAANHGGAALISIGTLVAMARLLDPVEFAVAAVAFSVVSLFTPLAEGFFNDVVLQRRSLGPRDLSSAWLASLALGAALSVLVWLAAPAVAAFVRLPEVAEVLPWMGLTLVIGSTAAVPAAFARRRGHYRSLAVRNVPGRLVGAALGVGAAALGFGAWSIVAQHLAGTTITTALDLAGAKLRLRPALFSFQRLRGLVRFSLASLTDMLILPAYARIATPLMSALLGPEP
ncbi:MAG: oligosaccharide flippase family protein, partial [Acetobacteraceae bacterium]|nr:oligosaccharide flippase family protein [Acetobacteraceae bacterium]